MGNGKGLSAAVMKNVALITMTIDHVTAILYKAYLNSQGVYNMYSSDVYTLGRVIGRIAFVLYAYMIAEGAVKTRNKTKYAIRLLALAAISIIPHSFANGVPWFNPKDLNIFFMLFIGLIIIYAYQWLEKNIKVKSLAFLAQWGVIAAACALTEIIHVEYGLFGVLLIVVFYICRDSKIKTLIGGVLVMSIGYMLHSVAAAGVLPWFARNSGNIINALIRSDNIQIYGVLALPIIYFYNGEKGRQLPKMFYYFYYPVHLGILAILTSVCF